MNIDWRSIYRRWMFPLTIGGLYWLFDTLTSSIYPATPTFLNALAPWPISWAILLRIFMTAGCVVGTKYFERVIQKLQKIERQLYLNEFALEHTKAFALMWTNDTGRIIKVNQYAAERLGYSKSELLGKTIMEITPSHSKEKWEQLLTVLREKENITYLTRQRRKNGSEVEAIVYLQYLKSRDEQFQFAFVCDAFHCPVSHTDPHGATLCGRPPLPGLETILSKPRTS